MQDSMLLGIKTLLYIVLCSLGGLQARPSVCRIDRIQQCGVVDKSTSASRWAIVAEDYYVSSTSE